jgi:hypothetical protein
VSTALYVLSMIGFGAIVAVAILAAWGLVFAFVIYVPPRIVIVLGVLALLFMLGYVVTHI